MAANTTPIYTGKPIHKTITISTANTNRDGTGTLGLLYTAGAEGAIIETIHVKASGTTTAGMIRVFKRSGSTYYLLKEISVSAITPSGTVQAFESTLILNEFGFYLEAGEMVYISTHNGESFNVSLFAGEF